MNLISIIALILMIGIIVFVHEAGHFLLAKKNGVGVVEFSIGMGPRLFSKVKNGTRYSIKALPFGGSCRMLGDDGGIVDPDAEPITDREHAFNEKSVWARISVIAAGPIFNFLLAFVLAVVVIGFAGADKATIVDVMEGYPAAEAGLLAGDEILSLNGSRIHLSREVQVYIAMNPGKALDIRYRRDGQTQETLLTPVYSEEYGAWLMGITLPGREKLGWAETLQYGLYEVRYNVVTVVKSLGMVLTGRLPLTSFSGPVGIYSTVNDIVEEVQTVDAGQSFRIMLADLLLTLANFAVMISANLGVMNLLPIPALDGGRLVFLFLEALRGKPVPRDKEAIVQMAGVIFLLFFMVFVLFHDVISLFR